MFLSMMKQPSYTHSRKGLKNKPHGMNPSLRGRTSHSVKVLFDRHETVVVPDNQSCFYDSPERRVKVLKEVNK